MLSRIARGISSSPTLAISAKAKQMKSEGVDIIGFGAGEPDFGTPQHIKDAAIQAINEEFTKYTPVPGIPELKEAICTKLKNDNGLHYGPDQIVISNGAKHSLANAFAVLLDPGDEVIVPAPYWVTYPELVKLCHGKPVIIDTTAEDGFKLTVAHLEKAVTAKTKALILNSPSNPTGRIYLEEELKAIADFAVEKGIFVISDEIYEKLVYGKNKHLSIASFNDQIKALTIVINGVSKSYAMTGWRIGYSASAAELSKAMGNIQSHQTSNANSIAQKAAHAALSGSQDCVQEMCRAFDNRRRFMVERIRKIPLLEAIEPEGAFYLFVSVEGLINRSYAGKVITGGDDFAEYLLEHFAVAVVSGSAFGAPNYIRLSYATSMENIERGLERIEKFVCSCT
ncbi:MAG: pyridoxal phosphate-dependent aminotransferase [Dethiobacteria bacterium]|jgi:aspartate aminotransferase|nr:pyridoxal phosphate-dependent aminotransferase [Bacillota bacterium]